MGPMAGWRSAIRVDALLIDPVLFEGARALLVRALLVLEKAVLITGEDEDIYDLIGVRHQFSILMQAFFQGRYSTKVL